MREDDPRGSGQCAVPQDKGREEHMNLFGQMVSTRSLTVFLFLRNVFATHKYSKMLTYVHEHVWGLVIPTFICI